ncbi:MAG: YaeQ family protein [Steroidobacteraceae bacterium]|jgi:uncharacterized protein YaeQ
MALGATIYVFEIELANSDREVYEKLELRVARHPSEAADYLLTRVLAYCLEYTEGISFSNGLFDSDAPAIAVRDLTGNLRTWIDVGTPEAARLHRAGKAASRVVVYTHKDSAQFLARLSGERIHRIEELELYAMDRAWLAEVERLLERRMKFSLTVAAQHLYLSIGTKTLSCSMERIATLHER